MGDKIGSLEVGKQADVIALDLSAIATQPVFDPISHLVYAADRNQVTHVWVNGEAVVHERVLTRLNQAGHKEKFLPILPCMTMSKWYVEQQG